MAKASKENDIPRTTLTRIFRQGKIPKTGRETILTAKEEIAIAEWVKECGRRGFGKTSDQVREAVKQVLDKAGRKVYFFSNNRPGKTWWYGFLRRHPDLHMVTPRPLELARALCCTQDIIFVWFDAFENLLQEYNIVSADQILNESGFPLQSCSNRKVCVDKLMKRSFHLASSSKTSITTLQCLSASGLVIAPAVYFPGKSLNAEYCLGFPKNAYLGFSDNGWMEAYHFYAWTANHFVNQIPPKRPVVLLIDGHTSHVDYNTTLFCKDNGILLFKLPPHTSHVMQPADRGFFNVFKTEWKKACSKFAFDNPGLVVTKRTFSRVFIEAYDRSARPDVAKASFKCAGIWPVNRHNIDISLFAPAKIFSKERGPGADSRIQTQETAVVEMKNMTDQAVPIKEGPCGTSTPKDDRHPIVRSLEQLEKIAGTVRVNLFGSRVEEGYDIEDDALFMAWKVLKEKQQSIEKEISEASFSRSNLSEDLCPIIDKILVYPQIKKNETKVRKKVNLPRHMTAEAALKILELQDSEKRRKEYELQKEARRKKERKQRERK